jgi:hypothetical protein
MPLTRPPSGALAVIDGERPTGPYRYELIAVEDDASRSIVNPETSEDLHDIFQGLVKLPDGRLRVDPVGDGFSSRAGDTGQR